MSLSCKPEWNTLLQSAKLAVEGRKEDGEQSERREEGRETEMKMEMEKKVAGPSSWEGRGAFLSRVESDETHHKPRRTHPIPFSDTMHKDCGGNLQPQRGAPEMIPLE